MKQASRLLALIPQCEEDRDIFSIVHNGEQVEFDAPKKGKDMVCPRCNSQRGFYIPYGKGWSCMEDECLVLNARRPTIEEKRSDVDLTRFGFTQEYSKASLHDFRQNSTIVAEICEFIKNPKDILTLGGGNGTGKTYATAVIAKRFIEKGGDSCCFIKMTQLYLKWLEFKDQGRSDVFFVQKYCDYKLLIIDDIGTRGPTEAFLDVFYLIIDNRKASQATVLTTNLTSQAFDKIMGSHISSRILSGKMIYFDGVDRRFTKIF